MALLKFNPLQIPQKILRIIRPAGQEPVRYKPLEDYGIIGNLETCALVAKNGSIDWLCLPHLESPSVFGALLDKDKGGFFILRPKGSFKSEQKYIDRTNVLQTRFSALAGEATLTDFMPPFKKRSVWHKHQILFRKIQCAKGVVSFEAGFQPRFNYARQKPRLKLTETGVEAYTKTEKLFLDSSLIFNLSPGAATAKFTLSAGEQAWFILQYNTRSGFTPKAAARELTKTIHYWERWAHKCDLNTCVFKGPWHNLVVRSGLVLKLLTHGETGAIAAAATTSLPEDIGGVRNWDYRFNWIRDSVFTAQALYNLGHNKEARELFNWYKRLFKGVKVKDIQIMTGLHGERDIPEKILRNLSGHQNSKPVRVGNAAAKQPQLDIYGEFLNIAYEISRYGESISQSDWRLLKKVVNYVCQAWKNKDAGIWEMRNAKKHYVYSKLMCWVAIDRGLKIAQRKGFKAPEDVWQKARQEIRLSILNNGFCLEKNSFAQAYGSSSLDASSLLIPMMGFLPFTDTRVVGTIAAALKYLTKDNLVYRYVAADGLPGQEGGFVLCTNWLIDALALSGQIEQAEILYKNLLSYASPLGLLAEQIDNHSKRQLGNFPQGFSHVGLINSALYIGLAKGRESKEVKPFSFASSVNQWGNRLFKAILRR